MGHERVCNFLYVNEDEHTPMSKLTRYWCYEDIREYVKPYDKRVYPSNKYDLSTNGWPAWVSSRVDEVTSLDDSNINVVIQVQPLGGIESMFYKNGASGSHSWLPQLAPGNLHVNLAGLFL